jgi:hypothetical protein
MSRSTAWIVLFPLLVGCGLIEPEPRGTEGGKPDSSLHESGDAAADSRLEAAAEAAADASCPGTAPTLMCMFCGCPTRLTAVCDEGSWVCPVTITGCPDTRCFPCGGQDSGVTCEGVHQICRTGRDSVPACVTVPYSPACNPFRCSCLDASAWGTCSCTDDGGLTLNCI